MLTERNHLLKLITSMLLCSILGGCTSIGTTKPNEPYPGPYPSGFNGFAKKSTLLAQELAKLPELQDGISEKEATGLERIINLYDANPDMFDKAFGQMYNVGIPEVRKYCSPLQALYWLALDSRQNEIEEIITNFNLALLIDKAWLIGETYALSFIIRDLPHILESMNAKEKELWEAINYYRWKDFDEVTDRLNSPRLISYYVRRDFRYQSKLYNRMTATSSYSIFKEKKGNCQGYADFQCQCLRKAGYDAKIIKVIGIQSGSPFHAVCEFKDKDGIVYIIDNSYWEGIVEKDLYTRTLPQIGYGKDHLP